MSALGGLYSRQGAPIERRELAVLSRALEQIGPDGEHIHIEPPVGMVLRPFWTDEGSRRNRLMMDLHGFLLTWNGRLDNPEELRRKLADELPEDPSHDEIVLATYRRWGIDGLAKLLGDFTLALWDPKQQRLVLACDALGIRPLFYHASSEFLRWSSRARSLLTVAGLSPKIDEHFVASFLTTPRPSSHSPFQEIQVIPPGHALIVEGTDLQLKRYWQLDPTKEIRYRKDEDYEEHFREIFRLAVACRMRAEGTVFSDLSGGLDSSSIVCVGDELLAAGEVEATDLVTVSYTYDRASRCDERAYAALVEEKRGRKGIHILDDDHPLLAPVPESLYIDYPNCLVIYQRRHEYLASRMREVGARVFLRGMAGDQVLWGESGIAPFELADHLVRGDIRQLLKACYRWSRRLRMPLQKSLWRGGIWPLLPRPLRARTEFMYPLEKWFHHDFIRRVDLHDYTLGPLDDVGLRLPSDRAQYAMICEIAQDIGWEFCLGEGTVEERFPFLDRRLVEFAMAIPLEQKLRPEETRSVLRRAMRGTLPEQIRQRRTKAGPDEAIYRALVRESKWFGELFAEPRVCSQGFVDETLLRETLHRARHGLPVTSPQLLRTIALELWLRSLETSDACTGRDDPSVVVNHNTPQILRHNHEGVRHEDLHIA